MPYHPRLMSYSPPAMPTTHNEEILHATFEAIRPPIPTEGFEQGIIIRFHRNLTPGDAIHIRHIIDEFRRDPLWMLVTGQRVGGIPPEVARVLAALAALDEGPPAWLQDRLRRFEEEMRSRRRWRRRNRLRLLWDKVADKARKIMNKRRGR